MAEVTAAPTAPAAPSAPAAPPAAAEPVAAAAAPVDTAPAVTQAPATVTPTPAPTAPVVTPEMRAYIGQLEQQASVAQQQEEARVLSETLVKYAARLEAEQGLTPEQAKFIADQEGRRAQAVYQQERFLIGQRNAAIAIAEQYGISPRLIADMPTPAAMHAAAQAATAQGKEAARLKALEAENAALKKKLAPAQAFSGAPTAGAGTNSGPVTRERLAKMTPAEYMEWRKNLK